MAKGHLRLVTPATINRTVRPQRPSNVTLRTREYLTEAEVERLMHAAKGNRWGHGDATMVLVAYRHGLQASELTDLRWEQVEFASGTLHVRQVKQGTPSTQRIAGAETAQPRAASCRSCSPRSAGHPSAPLDLRAWSSGRGSRPSSPSRRILTCSGTPAATRWLIKAMTHGGCRLT